MQEPGTLPTQFLLYAALFRLAIVVAGITCVVFGYRLLDKAVGRKRAADGSLVASVGEARLALRNLGPGTMFAAFGMIVVGVMLYQGIPELKQGSDGTLVLRSDAQAPPVENLAALTQRAMALEQGENPSAAIEGYEEALDLLATPANNLAWLYLQQNRSTEALGLARFAADLRPGKANILDTLAEAYKRNGNYAAALANAERAAELDPKYRDRLKVLRAEVPR